MDGPLSFSDIYRQHAEAVFRLAWLLTGDRSDAEDLTSEAFARALAGEGSIVQATVPSYLYAIVRNLATSRLRRPAVEMSTDDDTISDTAALEPGPEQFAELRQRLARTSAGLATLRASERQVLLLCGLHGLGAAEAADALGLEPGNVRVRLHRARRQLEQFLHERESHHGPA
ncbi:MAG: RNA polymerase sigma factor [Arenimonas sp.]